MKWRTQVAHSGLCERSLMVWRWCCSTTQEVGCVVECHGSHGVPFSGALFVDFQWSVKFSWRMGVLDQQDGAVVGVSLPLPT